MCTLLHNVNNSQPSHCYNWRPTTQLNDTAGIIIWWSSTTGSWVSIHYETANSQAQSIHWVRCNWHTVTMLVAAIYRLVQYVSANTTMVCLVAGQTLHTRHRSVDLSQAGICRGSEQMRQQAQTYGKSDDSDTAQTTRQDTLQTRAVWNILVKFIFGEMMYVQILLFIHKFKHNMFKIIFWLP